MSDPRPPAEPSFLSWSGPNRRGAAEDAFSRLAKAKAEIATLRRELEQRNALLERLVGASVCPRALAAALSGEGEARLEPTLRVVTVLMSDLRGFSGLCERTPPLEVLDLLNRFATVMGEVVKRYGGVLQDVHGDALVAVFGAFDDRDYTQDRAVACAIAMQNALEELNEAHRAEGRPLLEMGVGLHSGEVAIGAVGAAGGLRPALVGRHANLASRVESFSVGGQVLVSDAVASPLGERLRARGRFLATPKGFDEPVTVLDVQGLVGPYAIELAGRPDELLPLAAPLPVVLQIVDGKQVLGPTLEGLLERLSPRRAEIRLSRPLRGRTDVRVALLPELPSVALYAKSLPGAAEGCALFRFTSLPPRCRERIDELYAEARASAGLGG